MIEHLCDNEADSTDRPNDDRRPLVLITLFGGGWHREMQKIVARFPTDHFRFAYIYGYFDNVHGAAELAMPHSGPRYPIRFLGPTRRTFGHRIRNAAHLGISFFEAFRLVRKLRPAVILSLGTASTIPLFVAGRLFGAKCLFVESLTRVDDLSLTGRILYGTRLSHVLYVQWRSMLDKRPRCRFAGAVL